LRIPADADLWHDKASGACNKDPRLAVITANPALSQRLIDTLYTEALLLADETRAYFDHDGHIDREALDPRGRVQFACEALKATTRLMHVIAWLARHRVNGLGHVGDDRRDDRLAETAPSEAEVLGRLPSAARRLILAGIDLSERVGRLADGVEAPLTSDSPARNLIQRLERAF